MDDAPRLKQFTALSIAAIGALSLAACGGGALSANSRSGAATTSAALLPRNLVVPLEVVRRLFPEVTREAGAGANATAVGSPEATRGVVYASGDGAKKVTISVDRYASAGAAASAFARAVEGSRIPGFTALPAPALGEQAFAGTVTRGAETHVGVGAVDGRAVVGVTLAGFDPGGGNVARLIEVARAEVAAVRGAAAEELGG